MDAKDQRRILIVDDDVRLTSVMGTVLELEGLTVQSVHSAEDALRALRGPAFHLIVLDVMLPGVDGIQVYRHLRESGLTTIPVLLCSALNEGTVLEQAGPIDIPNFLHKPFTLKTFATLVRSSLREANGASSHDNRRPAPGDDETAVGFPERP